jgi:hypothetical protein
MTHLKEGRAMKRVFLVIVLAVSMFGVAAFAMARHAHHPHKAYVDCSGSGC